MPYGCSGLGGACAVARRSWPGSSSPRNARQTALAQLVLRASRERKLNDLPGCLAACRVQVVGDTPYAQSCGMDSTSLRLEPRAVADGRDQGGSVTSVSYELSGRQFGCHPITRLASTDGSRTFERMTTGRARWQNARYADRYRRIRSLTSGILSECLGWSCLHTMRAYSIDLRQRIVQAVESGMSLSEAARVYRVGRSTVKRYLSQQRVAGDLTPKIIPRRP